MNRMRFVASFLLLSLAAAVPRPAHAGVKVLTVWGTIDPVIGYYIAGAMKDADAAGDQAVVIELDTPGGLLDATRTAIAAMANARTPVIVFVGPRGARATSAGAFLTMAADVAAMAPETHIGAAHPVTIGGSSDSDEKRNQPSVMEEKMVSDAAAYMRALAVAHGRNAAWAERAVRESVSLTSSEAVQQKVIDVLADDRTQLLEILDGRAVKKNGVTTVLALKGAPVVEVPLSPVRQLLHRIAHPNIAYVLMTIGIYGLIYEMATPGIGLGGAVGTICLLLAFFALQVLPVNMVGVLLIALGIILLVLEMMAPSHGLLTVGGLLSFAVGSFFLIDVHRAPSVPRVSLWLIGPTVVVTGLFFGVALRLAWIARRSRPKTGRESLVGAKGRVERALAPEGLVFMGGELWIARSTTGEIPPGADVIVRAIDGNRLTVEKA